MNSLNQILILFAHPALEKSRVNRQLIRSIHGLDGVTIHDLYETYPDFNIQVKAEQDLLLAHDIIVFHHPFYWYSSPALLKEWQDLVLEYGFAYGEGERLYAVRNFFRPLPREGVRRPTAGMVIIATPSGNCWCHLSKRHAFVEWSICHLLSCRERTSCGNRTRLPDMQRTIAPLLPPCGISG